MMGACNHDIDVKLIPFSVAQQRLQLCVDSTESLLSAAEILQGSNPTYAFFLVLTAYEELAKSRRILDAASISHVSQNDMPVEDSMFSHHETKYKVTMDYLDYWISTWDSIRLSFWPNIPRLDTRELRADRDEIRQRGFKLRMSCLYVDFLGGWIQRISVQPEKVERNLQMAKSMLSGFVNSLQNWQAAIS
jgi:AbiV family abortive infection protein